MFHYYEATENSDLTEGRGHQKTFAAFEREEDAVEAVKGHGVQGVGDGEVYRVTAFSSLAEWKNATNFKSGGTLYGSPILREKVYGYRRDWRGQWGSGYVDNRDAPVNDPEYAEYVRLKNKFGDKS